MHRKYVPSIEMQAKLLQKSNLGETVVNGGGDSPDEIPGGIARDASHGVKSSHGVKDKGERVKEGGVNPTL